MGVVIVFLLAFGWAGLTRRIMRAWLDAIDPTARLGLSGLLGLGIFGTLSFFIPVGFLLGVGTVLSLAGWFLVLRDRSSLVSDLPRGPVLVFSVALGVLGLIGLVGVLAPVDTVDWDTLAYHFAAPKIWLKAGHIEPISFMHHSNFPLAVDAVFLTGLQLGEAAAKSFNLLFALFGCLALFGLARERYGATAGWWAALAFASIPTVLWESGTGYVDMAHGLFVGLGAVLVFSGRKGDLWLGAILLGLGAGSKYTGLLTLFLACFVVLVDRPIGIRSAVKIGLVALAICSPWYVRNVVNSGNPVYPFFYEKLGGKNWSEFNARIYREEQDTFGVPREGLLTVPHAILGLAYQPGRYANPNPRGAQGLPVVAFGAALFVGALAWGFSGQGQREERRWLAWVLLSLLAWAFLSQQARYALAFAPPLALLVGGGIVRLRAGPLVAVIAGLQGLYSAYLLKTLRLDTQLPVVIGKVSREEYLTQAVGFFEPAQALNRLPIGRVALYDEVFGYLLDVPYFWANPGHSMELDYAAMAGPDDLIAAYRKLGITHVYLNLAMGGREATDEMVAAMGLSGSATPYSPARRTEMFADPRTKWRVLVAEAVASGRLGVVQGFRRSVLFELR